MFLPWAIQITFVSNEEKGGGGGGGWRRGSSKGGVEKQRSFSTVGPGWKSKTCNARGGEIGQIRGSSAYGTSCAV